MSSRKSSLSELDNSAKKFSFKWWAFEVFVNGSAIGLSWLGVEGLIWLWNYCV